MTIGIYKQTAGDIMTRFVETLTQRDSIHHALAMMAGNDLSAIPVVDPDGRCVGIITQRDIIAEAREMDEANSETATYQPGLLGFASITLEELTGERVEDMMSKKVMKVFADDLVTDIADKMLKYGVHHLPVVDEEDYLVGIVSTMDILNGLRGGVAVAP